MISVQWGNLLLVFDHPVFQEGYKSGRQYYFEDAQDAEKHHTPLSHLSTSHLLRVIAMPDESGYYQLDDGCHVTTLPDGIEELVGYLSGPLHRETVEEYHQRLIESGAFSGSVITG